MSYNELSGCENVCGRLQLCELLRPRALLVSTGIKYLQEYTSWTMLQTLAFLAEFHILLPNDGKAHVLTSDKAGCTNKGMAFVYDAECNARNVDRYGGLGVENRSIPIKACSGMHMCHCLGKGRGCLKIIKIPDAEFEVRR